MAAARQRSEAGLAPQEPNESSEGLEEVLAPLRAAKWPTSSMKSAREKATRELQSALSEMRSGSNDARRHRSGEERQAASELRRAAEDATERVRKVAEAASQRELVKADRAMAAKKAFHGLPLTAKLRVLVADKAAYVFIGGSFLAGAALMFAILGEVYFAWGCGLHCGER